MRDFYKKEVGNTAKANKSEESLAKHVYEGKMINVRVNFHIGVIVKSFSNENIGFIKRFNVSVSFRSLKRRGEKV